MATNLELLFDEHYDAVHAFVRSLTRSRETAQDIVGETFLEATRCLATDPDAAINKGWLFVVARRRLIDSWRRDARSRTLEAAVGRLLIDQAGSTNDSASRRIERLSACQELLEPLPEHQRSALFHRYVEGRPVSFIASELGISYVAAESLLARARRRLATSLQPATAIEPPELAQPLASSIEMMPILQRGEVASPTPADRSEQLDDEITLVDHRGVVNGTINEHVAPARQHH